MILVLVFHVWPGSLPAGYIGVDVFFVISGFLITGLLFRELEREGRISFTSFYIRRFQRLMPAASLVIFITLLLSFLLEPEFRKPSVAIEGLASALYWQNWLLAWRATDYLASGESLGPLTHYWSLSIEEQFYLIWPGILALTGVLATRRSWNLRTTALAVIAVASGTSLLLSVWLSQHDQPRAYFVTHTRIWELGLGAMLALAPLPSIGARVARVLSTAALVVIVASAFLIPESAPFPGLIALIPTLAAVLFIFAGASLNDGSASGILGVRPVQGIGDSSYSIYLWHWPLVYFSTAGAESDTGLMLGSVLLAASLLIGWISWRFVEEPFRYKRDGGSRFPGLAVPAAAVGLIATVALAGLVYMQSNALIKSWEGASSADDHPGARVLDGDVAVPLEAAPIPPLVAVKSDIPVIYPRGCHTGLHETKLVVCWLHEVGEGAPLVAVVGDSHAGNWVPALREAAARSGWNLVSLTKSACSVMLQPSNGEVYAPEDCVEWSSQALRELEELAPDLVLLGRSRRGSDFRARDSVEWVPGLVPMLETVLRRLQAISGKAAVIADTPRLPLDPPECMASGQECTVSLASTLDRPDAMRAAVDAIPAIDWIDLRHLVCPDGRCPAVIGNVVVWRDNHHLTATYSRSLGGEMQRRIRRLLEGTSK